LVEPARVKAQLEAILASPKLVSAPSLQRFLRHVVEETLASREQALKEYGIGSVVFGRGQDFNPKTDPIVRVQARNVRARLEQYYARAGAGDAVVIELPKGTYVPVFHVRERPRAKRGWLVTVLTLAAAIIVLAGAAVFESRQNTCGHGPQASSRQFLSP